MSAHCVKGKMQIERFIPSRAFRSRSEGLPRAGLHVHDGS